jgi:hypothetical protein
MISKEDKIKKTKNKIMNKKYNKNKIRMKDYFLKIQ